MGNVTLTSLIPATDPDTVFARIADFDAYAKYTDAVRDVQVHDNGDGTIDSEWSVNFRNGILCWAERDQLDHINRTIVFTQTTGDFATFTGSWQVTHNGDDVSLAFTADFDLGMPSLAALIDPVAERTLRENITAIIHGLFPNNIDDPTPHVLSPIGS